MLTTQISVTLRNVYELMEFSEVYNAPQLKRACLQFMCVNSASLLEGRYMYVRSFGVLLYIHCREFIHVHMYFGINLLYFTDI